MSSEKISIRQLIGLDQVGQHHIFGAKLLAKPSAPNSATAASSSASASSNLVATAVRCASVNAGRVAGCRQRGEGDTVSCGGPRMATEERLRVDHRCLVGIGEIRDWRRPLRVGRPL